MTARERTLVRLKAPVISAHSNGAHSKGSVGALAFLSCILLAFLIAPMSANASHTVDRFVGGLALDGTEPTGPFGVAVNQSTGQIYVADSGGDRLQRLSADGDFELMWGGGVKTGAHTPEICSAADLPCMQGVAMDKPGMFDNPMWVAVSPVNGHVYVVDRGFAVQEFDPDGHLVRVWGWGVQDGAEEFQVCSSGCQSGLDGHGPGQLGETSNPTNGNGIAVNPVDGDVFVQDPENRRVMRFNADGTIHTDPAVDEVQRITIGTTGGTYTLTFKRDGESETTTPIPAHASAAVMEERLEALGSIDPADVSVSGGPGDLNATTPYIVTFSGALGGIALEQLSANTESLDTVLGITVDATSGTYPLEVTTAGGVSERTDQLAFDASPATIKAALEALDVVPNDSVAVSGGPGNAGGTMPYTVVFEGEKFPDEDKINRFEVAPFHQQLSGGAKQAKTSSEGTFEIDTTTYGGAYAISAVGHLEFRQPRAIAIDSQGILYMTDSQNSGEIERYDTAGVHGPQGFLAPIASPPLLAGSTVGLAVDLDPEGDGAVGADTDRLYVLSDPALGDTEIQQLDSPGELLPPAAETLPRHGVGVFDTSIPNGHGYNSTLDRFYVASDGGAAGNGIFILDADGTQPNVAATVESVSQSGTDQLDVGGQIDPGDGLVRYRLEYSIGNESTVTQLPFRIVDGSGSQAISDSITSTQPNTVYHVRIYAEKVIGVNEVVSTTSAEVQFKTAKAAPAVETRGTHSFTDTSAWIVGEIDPNGLPTTYHFEWGTTDSYTAEIPVPIGDVGEGNSPIAVMQKLEGLEPNATYHYRIVADNGFDVAEGQDRTFTTRPAFGGFADRDYEQVTPVDKRGASIRRAPAAVAADGSAAAFDSVDAFGDAPVGSGGLEIGMLEYQARRNPAGDGWTTKTIIPRAPTQKSGFLVTPEIFGGAGDTQMAFFSVRSMLSTDPEDSGPEGYVRDWHTGNLTPIYAPNSTSIQGGEILKAASRDLSHLVLESTEILSPGAPPGVRKIYEWSEGGIQLVSIGEGGDPLLQDSRVGRRGAPFSQYATRIRSSVSEDGQHIFFSSPPDGDETEIYRRSEGQDTTVVSTSQASVPDPQGPQAKRFVSATPDGQKVFFLSSEQLTDEANTGPTRAGVDLYRYNAATDALTDISAESNDVNGAQVRGVLGTSDDGRWVYYVARGRVLAGQGKSGESNVYLWHDDGSPGGKTSFITTLGESNDDESNFAAEAEGTDRATASRVSPDGQVLLLQSRKSLTGYANEGFAQQYVYEAQADGGSGALSCVSCRPSGSSAAGEAQTPFTDEAMSDGGRTLTRVLSNDGERIVFQSSDALLPQDANGRIDVYLWEAGQLSLVSTGDDSRDSLLWGASESGDDVFFMTAEQLVGQDDDGLRDLYDYRVGGGIPEQNPGPPGTPCTGSACKPPLSGPEPAVAPASDAIRGEGDVNSASDCGRIARSAKRTRDAAKKTRRRVARVRDPERAVQLERTAVRLERASKRISKQVKRCRAVRARETSVGDGGTR